jgi:hypothetical protein
MPVHDVAKAQERIAEACDFSIRTLQRIISAGNVEISPPPPPLSAHHPPSFVSVTLSSV